MPLEQYLYIYISQKSLFATFSNIDEILAQLLQVLQKINPQTQVNNETLLAYEQQLIHTCVHYYVHHFEALKRCYL